jgi:hypothetical protein
MAKTKTPTTTAPVLPAGIVAADLIRPSWKLRKNSPKRAATRAVDGYDRYREPIEFELWHTTGFGWCIPTLLIAHATRRRAGLADRTYAARVDDGTVVRIGFGPHVTARVTVYVTVERLAALQKFVDLQHKGAVDANTIRDRISSRRARTASRSNWGGF